MNTMVTDPGRRVTASLLRIYRPVALWFWSMMALGTAIAEVALRRSTDDATIRSLWLMIAGSAAKYWMLVIGILLVVVHLRIFVANGITRRDFTVGAILFGVVMAAAYAVVVIVGHGLESLLFDLTDAAPAGYPAFSAGLAVDELSRVFPAVLAGLVSGWLIGVGYYRFNPFWATLLIAPALVPLLAAEFLVGIENAGGLSLRPLPYGAALPLTLVITALGLLAVGRLTSEVAIRRLAA